LFDLLSIPIALLTPIYIFFILASFVGLFRLRYPGNKRRFSVSVIVPVRNEEEKIGRCLDSLLAQDYPDNLLEIIVVDDGSQDRTAQVVESYQEKGVRLIKGALSGKKAAVDLGIRHSKGEIILTTDGDCIPPPTWVKGMVEGFNPDIGMVAGRTEFSKASEKSLFHKLQSLEFLGIVAAEAGAIGIGFPATCNGSNLAYRREAYMEAGGVDYRNPLLSGDDDLLMHTIKRKTSWKIAFSVAPETFIQTEPVDGLGAFLSQRIRWASKAAHYPSKGLIVVLSLIFIYFLLLLVSLPPTLISPAKFSTPLISFLLKSGVELTVVMRGSVLFKRRDLLPYYPIAQLFHVPYIVVVSVLGFLGRFDWKGRNQARMRRERQV